MLASLVDAHQVLFKSLRQKHSSIFYTKLQIILYELKDQLFSRGESLKTQSLFHFVSVNAVAFQRS